MKPIARGACDASASDRYGAADGIGDRSESIPAANVIADVAYCSMR